MGIVKFVCPNTGEPVSTKIETDAEGFAEIEHRANLIKCDSCGERHHWLELRRWLDESVGADVRRMA